ncbi:hypothetical protein [Natrinema sp. HArc-T2]|uniref:hypothetical protein n=1 Tax=Natrinema sp. HArc-T2 TaxID=3242701 RepID=UPI00359DB040
MNYIHRRTLLAIGATGLVGSGAGCLNDDNKTDERDPGEQNNDGSDLRPPARWIPTSAGSDLFFKYTDLETVRSHEDSLLEDTIDEIPFAPSGAGGRIVGRLQTEPTFEYILEFGPEGESGHYVIRGTFDLAGLDVGDPIDEVGEFEVFEAAGESVAASSDTLVVVDPEVGSIDDVLAAGLDGTDRRVDSDGLFETVLEHMGDDTLGSGIIPKSDERGSWCFSWAIESETTTYTQALLNRDTSGVDEDELEAELANESSMAEFETVSVDIDGDIVVTTGTRPTTEFQYNDFFAKRKAGRTGIDVAVSIDVETATQTVTVTLTSFEVGGHVEVRDSNGTQATLTEQGQEATLEYDVGDSETISVVHIHGDRESEFATETVEF